MKKLLVSIFAGLLFTVGLLIQPFNGQTAQASTQTIQEAVVTGAVNFRTAPSTNSRVLATVPRGTNVKVIEQVNSHWVKAEISGRTGYLSTMYLTAASGSSGQNSSSGSTPSQPGLAQQQKANNIISTGLKFRGTPYQFGAAARQTRTFDCSSFVQYVFGVNNISLPRNSRQQATVGTTISVASQLQKGDLIFFKTGNRSDGRIDHVAIYMGDGRIIHAVPNGGVKIDNFSGYWRNTAVGAKRVIK